MTVNKFLKQADNLRGGKMTIKEYNKWLKAFDLVTKHILLPKTIFDNSKTKRLKLEIKKGKTK